MTITIDCNSDELTIQQNKAEVTMKCKNPNQTIEILQEIFHRMGVSNITLEKIDEDMRTTVDEW